VASTALNRPHLGISTSRIGAAQRITEDSTASSATSRVKLTDSKDSVTFRTDTKQKE
jgi:hypothetical protein